MSYRIMGYRLITPLRDNTCQIDYGYMCIRTDRANLHFSFRCRFNYYNYCLQNFVLAIKPLRFHTCIVTDKLVFMNKDT